MELNDFSQKKCNSGKNIQFMPKKNTRLNLEKSVTFLEKEKALIEIETPSLLIFTLEGLQIDLNKSGKTIVKTENQETAKKLFSKMLPAISKSIKQ